MKSYSSFLTGWPLAIVLAAATGCSSNPDGLSGSSGGEIITPSLSRGIVNTDNGLTIGGQSVSLQSVTVSIDGESGSISSLKEGMWVTVERQNGVIQSISYHEDVKGPIDVVELDGTLSVLGQQVKISSSTYFDDAAPGTLRAGDVVEVSGLRDANDNLTASRIELKQSATDSWSVRGQIRQLDRSLSVFVIGGLTVDYSLARFDDMNESSMVNGLEVEIKNESRSYEPGSLYLLATTIENHESSVRYPPSSSTGSDSSTDDPEGPSSDDSTSPDDDSGVLTEVEIVGIVTGFDTSAGTMKVEGIEVTTSFSTEYQMKDDRYVSRDDFFAMLRQGISVIKVKWRPFTGYDQPPHELQLES